MLGGPAVAERTHYGMWVGPPSLPVMDDDDAEAPHDDLGLRALPSPELGDVDHCCGSARRIRWAALWTAVILPRYQIIGTLHVTQTVVVPGTGTMIDQLIDWLMTQLLPYSSNFVWYQDVEPGWPLTYTTGPLAHI